MRTALNRLVRQIRPLTQSGHLGTGAILPHALPQEVLQVWQGPLKQGGELPDVAGRQHAAFPLSQVGGDKSRPETVWGRALGHIQRITKKFIASVVVVSLQIGAISPLGYALAQSGQPGYMRTPNTGYAPNGDLYINAQRFMLSQDPYHQQQHNNQVPGLFMVDAVQFSKPVSDPTFGQGSLAQMENHTVNLGLPAFDILFTRLYLTVANPYTTPDVGPYPNYQTYRDALTNAQAASYSPVVGGDSTPYVFKTLTSPNAAMRNMLVTELPTSVNFQAALERPAGTPAGAVGVRVGLNGEMAALQDYIKNTKPYDFSYQSAMGPYATAGQKATYNANGALDIDPTKDTASFFMNWTLGSNDVQSQLAQAQKNGMTVSQAMGALVYDNVTGRYYIPTGGAQEGQTNIFDANFMAMAAPQQSVVNGGPEHGMVQTGESGLPQWDQLNQAQKQSQDWQQEQQTIARTQAAQASANSIDFSQFQSPNALFGQGYDLYRYNPNHNPNGETENALMRRLMNGELTVGSAEYDQATQIAQQRYREQYAYHQITGEKLTFSVTDAQAKANSLNLDQANPNTLFGEGYNLFKYAQNEEERQLLRRLQAGELVIGSDEYERAAAVARQAFRIAYADSMINGTKKEYSDNAAANKANQLDLTDASVTELFGSGFDLYRWAHTDNEKSMLRRLQSGELRPGTDEYKVALSLAQQYFRNAYAEMLNPPPPPPPKKVPKWKKIVAAVAGAVVSMMTGGAAIPFLTTALGFSTAVATAVAGIVGSVAGSFVSTAILTGDIGQAFNAAGKALVSGSIKAFVVNVIGLGPIGKVVGGAIAQKIVYGADFEDALVTGAVEYVVDDIAKEVATEIGLNAENLGVFGVEAAHALTGCLAGAIKAQSESGCVSGAVGAVVGHVSAPVILAQGWDPLNTGNTQGIIDSANFFAGVVGGTAAAIVGDSNEVQANFNIGSSSGENAAANNANTIITNIAKYTLRGCMEVFLCYSAIPGGLVFLNAMLAEKARIKAQNPGVTDSQAEVVAYSNIAANGVVNFISKSYAAIREEFAGGIGAPISTPTGPSIAPIPGSVAEVNNGPQHTGNTNPPENNNPIHTGGEQIPDVSGPSIVGGGSLGGADSSYDGVLLATDATRDPRLPIKEPTIGSNGLKIESNGRHTPGMPGYNTNAGTEPKNSLDLFNNSIPGERSDKRYTIDENGNIHRFVSDGRGGAFHWNGSTGDKYAPLNTAVIPPSILRIAKLNK